MSINLPLDADSRKNWAALDPDKAAARVDLMVQGHERSLSWRHYMSLRGAAAWSGVGLGDLFQNLSPYDGPSNQGRRRGRKAYAYGGWGSKVNERWAHAACEALCEKLTGLDEPKMQLVATDVEWELRRQGIWADRFVEGNMHRDEGSFQDSWDLCRHGFLVAAVSTGAAGALTEPDYVGKRVRTQLRTTLNCFIDPGDVAFGMPLSYFDISWENPEYLCEDPRWKGKEDLIWAATVVPPHQAAGNYDGASFGTRMIKVTRAWRMPFGSRAASKGRQAIFIGGGASTGRTSTLFWGDWLHPEPPLAIFRIGRCLGETFWSENLIEIMLDPLNDAEDIDDMAKQTMSRTSQTIQILDGTTASPAPFVNAKDVVTFRYSSKRGEQAPNVLKPEILHDQYLNWRDRKVQVAKELLGVPDMHITSESPAGTDSGKAKRIEASLLPERFAKKLRLWRNWVACQIGKNHIRAAREIGKVDPQWQVRWPGADFDAKVPVKVLDIDDAIYEIQAYAVAETKNTPQDRAQYAQELFDRGQIDKDQLELILGGLYDTVKETKQVSSLRKYVAKTVDEMLHGAPELVQDENRYMAEKYMPPAPWDDPGAMLAQVLPIYRQAVIDGVPQNRLDLVKRFVGDILAIKANNDREAAMANARVNVAATPEQAFPSAPGAGVAPPPQLPNPVPGPEMLGGNVPPAAGMVPAQNVAGAPGLA